MQSSNNWELCKENIQPLKKGRNMENLQSALLPPGAGNNNARAKLLQKREYEELLRSYVGEDPLQPWHVYIKWTEQNFPKGGREGSLLELLQQCVLTFREDERYSNDVRFVEICLNLADVAVDPMEVYQYMYSQNIGCKAASFYKNWALHLENVGNIKKADAVLLEGLKMGAKPKEEMEISIKQFNARIMSNLHDRSRSPSPESNTEEQRTTLGALKQTGKMKKVGTTRTGAAKARYPQGMNGLNTATGSNEQKQFAIYNDENSVQQAVLPPKPTTKIVPPMMPDSRKENERKPAKWTEAKIRQHATHTPGSQRAFQVHVDENTCTPQQPLPSNKLLDANVLSSRKVEYCKVLEGAQQTVPQSSGERVEVLKYCKEKLFLGVTEFQFEELRAIKYKEKHDKERRLQEREQQLQKREEEVAALSALLKNLLAKKGSCKIDDAAKFVKPDDELLAHIQEVISVPASCQPKQEEEVQNSKVISSTSSSATSSLTKTKTPNSGTPGSATMHCLLDLWNGTLAANIEEESQLGEISTVQLPSNRKKCAFTVFGDDAESGGVTEKRVAETGTKMPVLQEKIPASCSDENVPILQGKIPASCSDENAPISKKIASVEADENLQNIPPKDYKEEKVARKIGGILQPAVDDPHLFFEDMFMFQDDDGENMDGIKPLDGFEYSINCPSNTAFMSELKIFSTPSGTTYASSIQGQAENKNQFRLQPNPNQLETMQVAIENFKTPGTRYYIQTKGDLSTISEASNEYKSSSSGSSSSAATSHFKSQFLRNKTPDASAVADKTDKSKLATQNELLPEQAQEFIDPFSDALIQSILANLELPLEKRKGYLEINQCMPTVKEKTDLYLGNDTYTIEKLCNKGGFAKIFYGVADDYENWKSSRDTHLAFKVQRPACQWEFYIATELQSRLRNHRISVDVTDSIMHISKMYIYRNGSIFVTKYHKFGTLLDVVNHFKSNMSPVQESLALYFTIEMLSIIEQLHRCCIIHGDVKPDNFVIIGTPEVNLAGRTFDEIYGSKTRCLKLIDYGRSIDMAALPPGTTFTTSVKTDMFQCGEMKDNRPWTYQTDFYGLASCTHVLLFGTYMKTVKQGDSWNISSQFKRYWHTAQWIKYFDSLLNIRSCDEQPDLEALRKSLESCLLDKKSSKEISSTVPLLSSLEGKTGTSVRP